MSSGKPAHKKAGIAVLIGRSNAGKSTLLNSLVGTKVAITSPKAQTTRHTIQGVVNGPQGQIVFVDTPGLFARVPDQLTQKLNDSVSESLQGIDAVVYVADPTRHVGDEETRIHRMVAALSIPKILVLNKMDLKRDYIDEYLAWRDEFAEIVEVSALQGKNVGAVTAALFKVLPDGEPLYRPRREVPPRGAHPRETLPRAP
jgi:GTPase